ncbi:MAG: hypothetical protein GJ680_01735 [Alteromonadaceae bacterium]|nr:hypothetical protein [Alteromonadaceae bacterium]
MKTLSLTFALLILSGCSSKQLYNAGQDIKCQEYERKQDIYRQKECEKGRYEDYRAQKDQLEQELDSQVEKP